MSVGHHHHHHHEIEDEESERKTRIVVIITLVTMVIEIYAGIVTKSMGFTSRRVAYGNSCWSFINYSIRLLLR